LVGPLIIRWRTANPAYKEVPIEADLIELAEDGKRLSYSEMRKYFGISPRAGTRSVS
jgi:hypothetical protein